VVDKLEIGALKFENQHLPVIFTSIMGNADGILGVAVSPTSASTWTSRKTASACSSPTAGARTTRW
jgi:hypothetical protein